MTQAEIEHVLNNGREVTQGEVTFVIGEGLSGEEKIILTIIGGTLMAAASSSTVEDPCNDIVNVEKHGDHATRDGKPVDDISTLRQLIKDEVVKIIDVAGKRYYIAKFRGEFVLISAKGGPGYWIVSTILTSDAINNLFKTIEDATDQINGDKETVYDPKNGIDC